MNGLSVTELKAKVSELFNLGLRFDRAFSRLERLRAVAQQNPATYSRYNELAARGNAVRSAISGAVQRVQSIYSWVKDNLGVNLGALPLIPIAVIGTLLTAIAVARSWIVEADNESRRLEIIAALPESQRARALAEHAAAPTWSGNLAKMAMWLALGAAVVFVLPKLLEKR